ncbi:hypothetical protein CLOM_g2181 [Closterium sp. NIES-68]|nr:hypothetical protein CLOM_g2181 [Closterium sp. NIES-68]GJP68800.1 hypothetical protein CLOP_g25457 [Closterium sp. NIES-67]
MTPLLSVLLCALISSLFVLSLYVWDIPRLLRGAPPANRDEPRVVCQRITSVLGSCLASAAIVAAAAKSGLLVDSHVPLPSIPRVLSLQPDYLLPSLAFPLLLVVLLFLGPLALSAANWLQTLAADRHQHHHKHQDYRALSGADGAGVVDADGAASVSKPLLLPLQPYDLLLHARNLLVAPLSEEFVFRAALCPLLLAGGFSVTSLVFICPLFFSLAHVHHIWNLVHYHRCSLPRAIAMVSKWPSRGCLAASLLSLF